MSSQASDSRYLTVALDDDHVAPDSPYRKVTQVLAFLFRTNEAGQPAATLVSVGGPGYAGVDANVIGTIGEYRWTAKLPLSVNEVRPEHPAVGAFHLSRRSMCVLSGHELPTLKYTGELSIDFERWLVMVPARMSVYMAEKLAERTRNEVWFQPEYNPIILEAAARHLNRHQGCQCHWAVDVLVSLNMQP